MPCRHMPLLLWDSAEHPRPDFSDTDRIEVVRKRTQSSHVTYLPVNKLRYLFEVGVGVPCVVPTFHQPACAMPGSRHSRAADYRRVVDGAG